MHQDKTLIDGGIVRAEGCRLVRGHHKLAEAARTNGSLRLLGGMALLILGVLLGVFGAICLVTASRNSGYVLALSLASAIGGLRLLYLGCASLWTGRD
jgi:hypothetical protein